MSIPEGIKIAGNLFSSDGVEALADTVADEGNYRDQFDQLRELLERRQSDLKDTASADEVGFYFLGRALHVLGYTHSHGEELPGNETRVDFTLFESSDDFLAHVDGRGTNQLFSGAVAVLKLMDWSAALDGVPGEETSADAPGFELDDILRQTGLQWAILTNGRIWRLYHRNTAGMLNTFYEASLFEILKTSNFGAYKFFGPVFSKKGLAPDSKTGAAPVRSLLA